MRWGLIAYWLSVSVFSVFACLSLMCIYLVLNLPGLLFAAGMYAGLAVSCIYIIGREVFD